MQVKLIEHTYEKQTPLGVRKRSLNQSWVMALNEQTGRWVQVGLIGSHDGAKFCPIIHDLDDGLVKEIATAIGQLLNRKVESANVPVSPPQIIDEMEFEDE